MPSIDESGEGSISLETFLAVGIALIVLASIFIALRLGASIKKKGRLFADDYVILIGLACLSSHFALNYHAQTVYTEFITTATESNSMSYLLLIHRIGEAILILVGMTTWFTKAPVLLILIRIFGVKTWLRTISYSTLVLSALAIVGGISYGGAICNPKGTWSPEFSSKCVIAGPITSLVAGVTGLIVDLIVFILPLPVIFKLNLSLGRKIGIALLFMAGIFAIIASAVGLHFRAATLSGASTDRQADSICLLVESSITLIAGCAPATYTMYTTFVVEAELYTKINSVVSRINITRTRRSKRSRDSMERENIQARESAEYIRMETPRKSHDYKGESGN